MDDGTPDFTAADYPGLIQADCWTCAAEIFNAAVKEALEAGANENYTRLFGTENAWLGHPSMYTRCGDKRCVCLSHHDIPCPKAVTP
jgi:hypothetical protein